MEWVTILGFSAAFCTTISFLPQAIKTIRTKQTKDLSIITYLVLALGLLLWLIYGILKNDLAIVMANAITLIFVFIIWLMIIKYREK